MKKLIALFMLCWLPLFMSSAWAMDLQMRTPVSSHQDTSTAMHAHMADMPCHMEVDQIDDVQMNADCHDCHTHDHNTHKCATCGLCMVSLSATHTAPFLPDFSITPTNAISMPDAALISLNHPPAIKPPIQA